MQITSIDVIKLKIADKAAWMAPIVVKVNTDEGYYGLGESGLAISSSSNASCEEIKEFAGRIIGMDPMNNESIWEFLHKSTFWAIGNGAVVMSAISAIDTALWDLKARVLNVPLYVLLGGKQRDALWSYASQLQFGWGVDHFCFGESDPQFYADQAAKAVEEGYTAIKANIISLGADGERVPSTEAVGFQTKANMKIFEARLNAIRKAVGDDVAIVLENHCGTDLVSAVEFAHMAEAYDIMFLEEAASPMRPDAFKILSQKTSIPLATGERTYTRWGFLPLIKDGALAMIQPDIGIAGGITEVKKICDMAQTYDVSAQMHVCCSPISLAVSLQLEAAIPNFRIHEHHMSSTLPCVTEMGLYDYQPVNGMLTVPDLPGIGQELSEKAMREAQIYTIK